MAAEFSQVQVGKKQGEQKKNEPLEIPTREPEPIPEPEISADGFGSYRAAPKEQSTTLEFETKVKKRPVKVIDVEVRVLYDTKYDVMGKRKSFVEFTIHDLNFSINRYQKQIDGHQRHLEVMKYTKERLTKLGKKSVSELAQGEQNILARKLKAAIKRNPVGEAA